MTKLRTLWVFFHISCNLKFFGAKVFPSVTKIQFPSVTKFYDLKEFFNKEFSAYAQADWDSFRSYIVDGPFDYFLKFRASKSAFLISEWIRN